MRERGGANPGSVGGGAAVANQVVAVVALGRLDPDTGLTGGYYRSPANTEKMVDQGIDILQGSFFGRRGGERMVGFIRPLGHVLEALANDAQTLADLIDPYTAAVVAVAPVGGADLKIIILVAGIGTVFAPVPVESGGTQAGAGHAPLDRLGAAVAANPLATAFDQAVVHHQGFVLVEPGGHIVDELAHHLVPAQRQILGDAADAEPARMHSRSGECLDNAEQLFAIDKHVEDRR